MIKVGVRYMVNKYNNQIYKMYVEETKKTDKLTLENKQLKKELKEVKLEFKKANEKIDNFNILIDKAVNAAVDRVTEKYEKKIEELNIVIKNQSEEIDRLRNRINKNSSNSSKPSSTEIISSKKMKIRKQVLINIIIELSLKSKMEDSQIIKDII